MNFPPELDAIVAEFPDRLIFATISGAHLYGFPSPDSDYDLRGCHVLPIERVIGLADPAETEERLEPESSIELDLVSHDIHKFCRLLLKPNGYVLEQLVSPLVVHSTPEHESLRSLVPRIVTRHHAHHYLGFARNQWRMFERQPRAKTLLYVYRVLLTGIRLMRTGVVEASLPALLDDYPLGGVHELIERKRTGAEKQPLDEADVRVHESAYLRLLERLEAERADSSLPDAPRAFEELNDLVVQARLATRSQG